MPVVYQPGRARWLAIVDLASVTDLDNEYHQLAVAHFVHDAVVPNPDAQPATLTGERLDARRARLDAQRFGGNLDPPRDLGVKLAKLPQRCRTKPQLVAPIGHSSSAMPSSAQTASAGTSSPGSAMAASAAAMSAASSAASISAATSTGTIAARRRPSRVR